MADISFVLLAGCPAFAPATVLSAEPVPVEQRAANDDTKTTGETPTEATEDHGCPSTLTQEGG